MHSSPSVTDERLQGMTEGADMHSTSLLTLFIAKLPVISLLVKVPTNPKQDCQAEEWKTDDQIHLQRSKTDVLDREPMSRLIKNDDRRAHEGLLSG